MSHMVAKSLPAVVILTLLTACSTAPLEGAASSEAAQTADTSRVNRRCVAGETDARASKNRGVFTLRLGAGESARVTTSYGYGNYGAFNPGRVAIAKVLGAGVTAAPPENVGTMIIEAPGDADYQITTEAVPDGVGYLDPAPIMFFDVECFASCKTAEDCTEVANGRKAECSPRRDAPAIGATKTPSVCVTNVSCDDGAPKGEDCNDNSDCACGLRCRGAICVSSSSDGD